MLSAPGSSKLCKAHVTCTVLYIKSKLAWVELGNTKLKLLVTAQNIKILDKREY